MKEESSFSQWFEENKNGDFLRDCYNEYCYACETMDEKPLGFRNWAKTFYREEGIE